MSYSHEAMEKVQGAMIVSAVDLTLLLGRNIPRSNQGWTSSVSSWDDE
jgi:hypothetical protein